MQIKVARIFLTAATILSIYQTGRAAEPAKDDRAAAQHLSAGNAALARSDFSTANSEWTSCLLTVKDIYGKIAKECEERLEKNIDRHTEIPPLKTMPRLARVARAPMPLKGLSGVALMKARTQNMYEAFLDCELLGGDIAKLRADKSAPGADTILKRAEASLRRRQQDLQESERFFASSDRVAAALESFSPGIRTVTVTFVNGKTLTVTEAVRGLHTQQKRIRTGSEPDLSEVNDAAQKATNAVDAIDQPVGETDAQRRRRLGLSPR